MTKSERRTPLRAAPLRVAGQSVEAEIDMWRHEHGVVPLLTALFMLLLAGLEWFRFWVRAPVSPWAMTVCALVATAYAVFKFRQTKKRLTELRLGRDTERAVAQYLEWFRTSGFFVFHDVPTGDANIDHVLVGPRGIYAIETKAASKPLRGECKATVQEDGIRLNGQLMTRDPIVQAKAQARWLHNFFKESQFKPFVQPVVLIPGWFVEPFDLRAIGVWVLELKALDAFIARQPERLTRDEVRAMGSALSSYIRAQSALS